MESTKILIGNLEGKNNWSTWKYKVSILLRSVPGATQVLDGNLKKPEAPAEGSTELIKAKYKMDLDSYLKTDTSTLLILTTNMCEDILKKVMRFTSAREVWLELHRLYDGISEDKAYELCMDFFNFKREVGDDMASHMSKLKNIWNSLKLEVSKDNGNKCDLPEIFLICKILGTLPNDFFSFRSSWMLMTKAERTVDNLTNQLCAFEKALISKNAGDSSNQEALVISKKENNEVNKKKGLKGKGFKCHYCSKFNHKIWQCAQWKADGRPARPATSSTSSSNINASMTLSAITSEILSAEMDSENWFVDNGATNHVTSRKDLFRIYRPFTESHTVITANGDAVKAVGKGDVDVITIVKGKQATITLGDVWYVPGVKKNLFSILQAHDKHEKSKFISSPKFCKLEINRKDVVVGKRENFGGLYKLDIKNIRPKRSADVNSLSNKNELQLYHERFGHQNKRHVKKLIERELGIKVKLDSELCEGCVFGKAHRLKFGTRERATKPGELIHSDVCGPFVQSLSRYQYFVLFKDDFSGFRFIYFIRKKSEVPEKLKVMLAEVKTEGYEVKELLSDNGGEFDNESVRTILQERGIKQRLTMPYTPEQNGCSERENRFVVETARSLMHTNGNLPQGLWAELINTARYLLNRTGPSRLEGKSPYEIWTGKKPSLKNLRIIGSTCYAHIPKTLRKKMDKKARKGILVGYDNDDGYRIWCRSNNKLLRSRDVIFQEEPLLEKAIVEVPFQQNKSNETPEELEEDSVSEEHDIPISVNEPGAHVEPEDDDLTLMNEDEDIESIELVGDNEVSTEEVISDRVLRDRKLLKKPVKFNDYVMLIGADLHEPNTYNEATQSSQKEDWEKAMMSEINSLNANKTWVLAELPKGKKPISCKWVYKIKTNPDGTVDKFKARLVIKGFSQKKGIDFKETFSPVAKSGTIRALISVAASEGMSLTQMDVSTAFLYGKLDEEIYMRQPEGYDDGSGRVCRLTRSLYGLKQAPRCWNKRISDHLRIMGFKSSEADPCLFVKTEGKEKLLLALYVDDGLIASTSDQMVNKFFEDLQKEFKITVKKPATYFLGIEIERKEDGEIKLNQKSYAEKVLERFNMSRCKPVTTTMHGGENFESGKVEKEDEEFPYRQAVGALMYLMTGTRPDLAYAVGVVSRNLENPTKMDVVRVKRILRYVRGTTDYGITYKPNYVSGTLKCFSDADHGGDNTTGRSTTGVICMYAEGAITWLSQRQVSVAISTTEAEIVAASEATREAVWLKRLYKDLTAMQKIPVLHVDNEASVKLAQNPEYHRRTKHITIRHFFVREKVLEGEINIEKVCTEFNISDMMTKPLHRPRLVTLCKETGLN